MWPSTKDGVLDASLKVAGFRTQMSDVAYDQGWCVGLVCLEVSINPLTLVWPIQQWWSPWTSSTLPGLHSTYTTPCRAASLHSFLGNGKSPEVLCIWLGPHGLFFSLISATYRQICARCHTMDGNHPNSKWFPHGSKSKRLFKFPSRTFKHELLVLAQLALSPTTGLCHCRLTIT